MSDDTLKQMEALNPWFYDVTIGQTTIVPGVGSPHTPEQLMADTQYKREILVKAIAKRYDFRGKKLLDLGSNCGYWSSHYARLGATSLLAIEGRERSIAQGNLYWQHGQFMKDNAYQFLFGDVNSEDIWKTIKDRSPFDFVLCGGLLYHMHNHKLLLQRMDSVVREVILIDTRVSDPGARATTPRNEPRDWKFNGIIDPNGNGSWSSQPTLDFLLNFFSDYNYEVETIRSHIPVHPLMNQADNYDLNRRITLLCRKK